MTRTGRRTRRELSLLGAAGRGAVAGVVGGVAMAVVDRGVAPHMGARGMPDPGWARQLVRGARRAGVPLAGGRRGAGLATTIAYGALVGAVYGVAYSRLRQFDTATGLLDAGLVYAATLMTGGSRPTLRSVRAKGSRTAMQRAGGPAIFGRATSMTFRMLAR